MVVAADDCSEVVEVLLLSTKVVLVEGAYVISSAEDVVGAEELAELSVLSVLSVLEEAVELGNVLAGVPEGAVELWKLLGALNEAAELWPSDARVDEGAKGEVVVSGKAVTTLRFVSTCLFQRMAVNIHCDRWYSFK